MIQTLEILLKAAVMVAAYLIIMIGMVVLIAYAIKWIRDE